MNAKAYLNRGDLNSKKGALEKAIRNYSKAIELDPKYTKVLRPT